MFNWLKGKPKLSPSQKLVVLLDRGLEELNPDQWHSDIDARLAQQPILVSLNRMLGREEAKRFFPLNYAEFVTAVGNLHQRGALVDLIGLNVDSPTIMALLIAGMHEVELQNGKQPDPFSRDIRAKAQTLLSWLNRNSTTAPQSR